MLIRANFNGQPGGLLQMPKSSDGSLNAHITDANGVPRNITGETVQLLVYDRADRSTSVIATLSGALTTPTAGYSIVSWTAAQTGFGPGTYYGYLRVTSAGGLKYIAPNPIIIKVN